jgi:hypothetical protein
MSYQILHGVSLHTFLQACLHFPSLVKTLTWLMPTCQLLENAMIFPTLLTFLYIAFSTKVIIHLESCNHSSELRLNISFFNLKLSSPFSVSKYRNLSS